MRFFYKLGKKNNPINTMLNEIKIFKKILNSKDDPYLGVDFEFYTKWKLLLRILVSFNKNSFKNKLLKLVIVAPDV